MIQTAKYLLCGRLSCDEHGKAPLLLSYGYRGPQTEACQVI